MTMALESRDESFGRPLDAPSSAAQGIEEHRPLRLGVPLMLAAGWGALLTFSVMFLIEDGRGPVPAPDRVAVAVADQPDRERVVAAVRPRVQETVQTTVAEEPAVATAEIIKVASVAPEPLPPAMPSPPATHPPSPPVETVKPIERVNYVGTWGPTPQACGATSRRRGYLPALITEDGAKAGRTLCRFRNGRRDGVAWTMAADCSERGRNWTSQVRLLVDGDRLIWSSAKGQSSYVRCGRRDG